MNPYCDRPECKPSPRFGVPLGHYEDYDDENGHPVYTSHEFDETNHPSWQERDRMRHERETNDPEHIKAHGDTVYHGTNEAHAHDILKTGFHLDNTNNGRHAGHGVYTTTSFSEASKYGTHVVEAKILRDEHHQDPFRDPDVMEHPSGLGKHAETWHHVMRDQGYIGHVDTDDPRTTHVTYNPKHVVPVAVHATGKTASYENNQAHADESGRLVNPADGSHDWHHGTPHKFTSFDPDHPDNAEHHDDEWDHHEHRHWNTYLGTHWTSLKDTARKFARGMHHNEYTAPKGSTGEIHTAHLGITNPKHFDSEAFMDREAFEHHWDSGRHDREDPHNYHDEVCEKPNCYHVAEHEGDDDVTEHVKGEYWGGNESKYLMHHPYKQEIAGDYREHLQKQGHDGVTYGNDLPNEGPVGHTCAITFDHEQVSNHRISPAPGIGKSASLNPHEAHPNLSQYRSGGVGHLEGDESRSVVGMVPLHALEPLREHDGIQNPSKVGHDRKIIDGIRSDLRSGHGLDEPIQVFHDPKRHHGYIGEGNHRLAALREEGHTHAPVRVHSRSNNSDRVEDGIGGPLHLATNFDQGDYPYTPPDVHPHHFHEFAP